MSKKQIINLDELRPDIPRPSTPREEILKAKKNDGIYFVVPKVRD